MHWNLFFISFFSGSWSWEGITRTKGGHLCHGVTVHRENYVDMCHMKAPSFNISLCFGIGQILWIHDLKTPVLICHILSGRLITDARSTGEKFILKEIVTQIYTTMTIYLLLTDLQVIPNPNAAILKHTMTHFIELT